MSNNNLNVFQQIYTQSFGASLAGGFIGTESKLQNILNTAIDKLFATLQPYGWSVTWGPRVWKNTPGDFLTGLDNAWFASYAPNVQYPDGTYNTVVVAIAGTAVYSAYGWTKEDFGVNEVVDFNTWTKTFQPTSIPDPTGQQNPPQPVSSPYSALGTSLGVKNVLSNTAPTGRPGANTNIIQYLQTLPANTRIIFTGHSLGGALSPTVPLALKTAGLLSQNTVTLPCAGASPGEQNLSTDYSNTFPQIGSSGYQVFNTDLYNKFDIVPQAWSTNPQASPDRNLTNILTIYGTLPSKLNNELAALIAKEIAVANSSGVTYFPIQGTSFSGTPPASVPQTFVQFLQQVAAQHTTAYYAELGLGTSISDVYRHLSKLEGVQKKNVAQAAKDFPVTRWAETHNKGLLDGAEDVYPYDVILQDYLN